MKGASIVWLAGLVACSGPPSRTELPRPAPLSDVTEVSPAITRYLLSATISPTDQRITATATISLRGWTSPLDVFLHRDLVVEKATIDGGPAEVAPGDLTLPYVDAARHLVVTGGPKPKELRVTYSGLVKETIDDVNYISDDVVELAVYAAWHPILGEGIRHPFELELEIPEGFTVVTRGARTASGWQSKIPGRDIPLFVSSKLKRTTGQARGIQIEVFYHALDDRAAQDAVDEAGRSIAHFSELFGEVATEPLRMVFSPRGGWGYSRLGYFVVSEERHIKLLRGEIEQEGPRDATAHGNAHEIAHFWWHHADVATDDWLNEALAEYSAAKDSERRLGEMGLTAWMDRYRAALEEAAPPSSILATKATDKHRYANWYQRGALFFLCTERKLGEDALVAALRKLRASDKMTTAMLREALQPQTGSAWLDAWLGSRSLEPSHACTDHEPQ